MRKKLALVIFASIAAVSMLFTGPANASTVYTYEADFLAAIKAPYYLQGFSREFNGNKSGEEQGPLNYAKNGYSFTVSSDGSFWWVESGLSTNNAADYIVISFAGTNVQAVGGIFWPSDDAGAFVNEVSVSKVLVNEKPAESVTVGVVTEISFVFNIGGQSVVRNFGSQTFTGVSVADGNYITGINIRTGIDIPAEIQMTGDSEYFHPFPTMNHLYVGSVATPIPGAVWLLGSGLLGLVGLKSRIAGHLKRPTSI